VVCNLSTLRTLRFYVPYVVELPANF